MRGCCAILPSSCSTRTGWGKGGALSSEVSFAIHRLTAHFPPPELVEIGTRLGKSTRRILDRIAHLRLETAATCSDIEDLVQYFNRQEAALILRDVTDPDERDIFDRFAPGII